VNRNSTEHHLNLPPKKPVVDLPTTEVSEDSQIPLRRRLRNLFRQLEQQGPLITLIEAIDQTYRMVMGVPTRRMSEVTPQLAVGGQQRGRGVHRLRKRGFTAVVNMRRESDDEARGLSLERYLYLPTIDNTPPTVEHLEEGAAFIADEIARGGKVYVHCWEGVGRAPTMACAYLITTGLTPDEAWARIRRTRPFIRPTPFQRAQIEEFARRHVEAKLEGVPWAIAGDGDRGA
jgi:protein tyrosine phosphatase (PTP) superfamily phosphohydrolase (DUF442 family)